MSSLAGKCSYEFGLILVCWVTVSSLVDNSGVLTDVDVASSGFVAVDLDLIASRSFLV